MHLKAGWYLTTIAPVIVVAMVGLWTIHRRAPPPLIIEQEEKAYGKGDLLFVHRDPPPSPKPIETETIILQAPKVKAEAQKSEPKRESDLCTRHKMHKVYTQGGRSWRCRK
jgi:hypothetical protein